MKKFGIHLLLLVLLLFPLFTSIPTITTMSSASGALFEGQSDSSLAFTNREEEPVAPGPDLGLANWTSSWTGNNGMETWIDPITPEDWWSWRTGDVYQWYASAPYPVNEGSQSGGMQVRLPQGNYDEAYWRQININADMFNLTLTFDWYLDQNEDPANDYFYARVDTYDSGFGWRYLYYTLNGSQTWSNGSDRVSYKAYGPPKTWNTFSRNLTLDFVDNPSFPSTIPSTLQVRYIYFFLDANGGTDQYLRGFLDDVNLLNETNSHIWIGGSTRNGNFEGSGTWQTAGNYDAGYTSQSSAAHSGFWSANSTAASNGNSSYCSLETYPNPRITAQNPGVLDFWWYLNYQHAKPGSRSYLYLSFYNGSQYFDIAYWLGYHTAPYSNNSNFVNIHVNGFNTTNTWIHCIREIWVDAASYFGVDELYLSYTSF
ncbi:MAG: hypothetical protein ACFFDP_06495, partial [Promethearchaeota archaeon]